DRPAPEPNVELSVGGFRMTPDGLEYGGEWVCAPFEIVGRARDPKGEGWSHWLRWHDPDGLTHTFAVSDAALHSEPGKLMAELALRGLRVQRKQDGFRLLDYLNAVNVSKRLTVVNQTGWHELQSGHIFVLPNDAIGQKNSESVMLDTQVSGR